ncbi:MAG: M20/M25/M40 family metallo-hydrolase [Oenococcus sp.]|uniref:M20/M25/M40 family metallo-hydrolase n=1 Tax=Oenococcus sp. TaxID=1979414 RepID=UPI0039E98572
MKEEEKLKILSDLISFKTVNTNEKAVADYLSYLFQIHHISSTIVGQDAERANLVVEIGNNNGPVLGFTGHADTVHEGDAASWSTNPFQAVEKDGKIYGRGTTDMKGGLAEFAIAVIELKEEGAVLNGTLRFLVTVGEEITLEGAKKLAQLGYVDDMEAVIAAEPTGVFTDELDAYLSSGGAIIDDAIHQKLTQALKNSTAAEQHFILNAHKGGLDYTVTAHGKAAHSSMPKLGVNAIQMIMDYQQAERALFASFTETNKYLGQTLYNPDMVAGGNQPNSIPDTAQLTVNVRCIPELPVKEIVHRVGELIEDLNKRPNMNLSLDVGSNFAPVESAADSRVIKILQSHAGMLCEALPLPTLSVSLGTDVSRFREVNPNIDMAIVGPGNTTAHQKNEFVSKSTYLTMINLFKETAKDYLK